MKYWDLIRQLRQSLVQKYWQGLSQRDRRVLLLGSITVPCLLAYVFLIVPLMDHFEQLENGIVQKQETLQWLKPAALRWQQLQHQGFRLMDHHSSSEPMDQQVVQGFSELNLSHYPLKVSVVDHKKVAVGFKKVPFDRFIASVNQLWKQQGWLIDSLEIKRVRDGMVSVTGKLEKLK